MLRYGCDGVLQTLHRNRAIIKLGFRPYRIVCNVSYGVVTGIATPDDGEIHSGPALVLPCSLSSAQTLDHGDDHKGTSEYGMSKEYMPGNEECFTSGNVKYRLAVR